MGLFVTSNDGRHRRRGETLIRAYLKGEAGYKPRHCAGRTCMHDHHDELQQWRNFHETATAGAS